MNGVSRQMDGHINGWEDGCGWLDGLIDGWMDG